MCSELDGLTRYDQVRSETGQTRTASPARGASRSAWSRATAGPAKRIRRAPPHGGVLEQGKEPGIGVEALARPRCLPRGLGAPPVSGTSDAAYQERNGLGSAAATAPGFASTRGRAGAWPVTGACQRLDTRRISHAASPCTTGVAHAKLRRTTARRDRYGRSASVITIFSMARVSGACRLGGFSSSPPNRCGRRGRAGAMWSAHALAMDLDGTRSNGNAPTPLLFAWRPYRPPRGPDECGRGAVLQPGDPGGGIRHHHQNGAGGAGEVPRAHRA